MAIKKNLISLKEASQISGFSADYIGQLIRSGKIPGKQVYCNVAWMTTANDVLNYKKQSEQNTGHLASPSAAKPSGIGKFRIKYNLIKLFFGNLHFATPVVLAVVFMMLALNVYLFYLLATNSNQSNISNIDNQPEILDF